MNQVELMRRIRSEWGEAIDRACASSSVPPAFIASLISLESGGMAGATRFEPAVFNHLRAVVKGWAKSYGDIALPEIRAEEGEIAKTADYHKQHLSAEWAARHADVLAKSEDAHLRQLASSYGLTQIMGYWTISWPEITPLDLTVGEVALKYTIILLSQFVNRFNIDPRTEFEAMLRAWNTGRPDGKTFAADYVSNGLERATLYLA